VLQFQTDTGLLSAGASDRKDPFLFGVDVEQDAAINQSGVEVFGAEQARFFIYGEQQFQGRVDDSGLLNQR
jgi:hypothetical protein